MSLKLADVFDEYPNPVYIIKPIMNDGISEDFEYIYVNKAFSFLLGRSKEELVGHRYLEVYGPGERQWLDAFSMSALSGKHFFVNNVSEIINKKMYTEIFHIDPDMCGCIIHDFEAVYDDLQIQEDEALRRKANCDFLTGFYNRFYLNEMHNIFNHKINTGITFLDINNLKVTNDTQGHQAGDELIVKISNMIRSLYSDSIVFRIGGDEFVIITEGRTEEDFVKMSDNAKAFFEKNNLAAIGYRYYERIYNLKECVEECDKLMYDEKRYMKGM